MLFSLMSSMGKLPYFNFMSSMSPFTNIPIPQNPTSDYHQKPILPPLTEEPKIKKEQPDPISEETLEQKPEKPEEEFEREKPSFIEKNEGIHKILKYFVQNIGRVRSNRINGEREKFLNNPELRQIFDLLMKKYIMSNKTKEEKIKYILRKAFKYLGNKLRKEHYLTKQVKSKKEFDQIFNDFYMSEKKSLLETIKEDEVKISESKNFKLIFT